MLTLNPDQTFDLTILLWDSNTHQHTGQKNVNGNWVKADKILTLAKLEKNKIIYELTTTNLKIANLEISAVTYGFQSNNKDFFATGFNLLEKVFKPSPVISKLKGGCALGRTFKILITSAKSLSSVLYLLANFLKSLLYSGKQSICIAYSFSDSL